MTAHPAEPLVTALEAFVPAFGACLRSFVPLSDQLDASPQAVKATRAFLTGALLLGELIDDELKSTRTAITRPQLKLIEGGAGA